MERKVFRGFLISAAILLAGFLFLSFCADLVWGNDYMDTLPVPEVTDDSYYILEGDPVLDLIETEFRPNGFFMKAHGTGAGNCKLILIGGSAPIRYNFSVTESGRISNRTNGNFSAFQAHLLLIIIGFAGISAILWLAFYRANKYLRYSYQSIFFCGYGIWTSVVLIILIYQYSTRMNAFAIYESFQAAGWKFVLYTSPLLVLFCIALCISNISLIRHERYRIQNALGIILSAVMLVGAAVALLLNMHGVHECSVLEHNIRNFLAESYAAVFVLLECFLQGAVICGSIAAKHNPPYDRDFVIILGCRFRKDGTLFPLIRGRVDRALEFYHNQINNGGKHPILVPSGGQGNDEPMPEAEAMYRYLIEQGIPEEDIMKEDLSRTTLENMTYSHQLIEEKLPNAKVAFSTTNYHVFRSGIISRQCGFAPEGMGSHTKWYFWPNAYVRECIGMIVFMKKLMILMALGLIALFAIFQFVL